MRVWRSLQRWWCWDGNPETDPFRSNRVRRGGRDADDAASTRSVQDDVAGHAHAKDESASSDDPEAL